MIFFAEFADRHFVLILVTTFLSASAVRLEFHIETFYDVGLEWAGSRARMKLGHTLGDPTSTYKGNNKFTPSAMLHNTSKYC